MFKLSNVVDDIKSKTNGSLVELLGSFILGSIIGALLLYVNVEKNNVKIDSLAAKQESQINTLKATLQLELGQIKRFIARVEETAILPEADRRTQRLSQSIVDHGRRLLELEAFRKQGGRFTEADGDKVRAQIKENRDKLAAFSEENRILAFRLSVLEQHEAARAYSPNTISGSSGRTATADTKQKHEKPAKH